MRLGTGIPNLFQAFIRPRAGGRRQEVARDLQVQLDRARDEWNAAERYFQTVSDPELVDHAIYSLEAARRKYLYLFRQLRVSQGHRAEAGASEWS